MCFCFGELMHHVGVTTSNNRHFLLNVLHVSSPIKFLDDCFVAVHVFTS